MLGINSQTEIEALFFEEEFDEIKFTAGEKVQGDIRVTEFTETRGKGGFSEACGGDMVERSGEDGGFSWCIGVPGRAVLGGVVAAKERDGGCRSEGAKGGGGGPIVEGSKKHGGGVFDSLCGDVRSVK